MVAAPKLWLIRGTILFDWVPMNMTATPGKVPGSNQATGIKYGLPVISQLISFRPQRSLRPEAALLLRFVDIPVHRQD